MNPIQRGYHIQRILGLDLGGCLNELEQICSSRGRKVGDEDSLFCIYKITRAVLLKSLFEAADKDYVALNVLPSLRRAIKVCREILERIPKGARRNYGKYPEHIEFRINYLKAYIEDGPLPVIPGETDEVRRLREQINVMRARPLR